MNATCEVAFSFPAVLPRRSDIRFDIEIVKTMIGRPLGFGLALGHLSDPREQQ
jgi:hypothetical protein